MPVSLPFYIAVLCYLFNESGQLLLLKRRKPPNQHLHSPIGGKLNQSIGESPTTCAVREILEETGLVISATDLHLTGIVSEAGFDNEAHWLMFLYEVNHPVSTKLAPCPEGQLDWHNPANIPELPIPQTDRQVLWPLFWKYRHRFFAAHIDCRKQELRWHVEQPCEDAGDWAVIL